MAFLKFKLIQALCSLWFFEHSVPKLCLCWKFCQEAAAISSKRMSSPSTEGSGSAGFSAFLTIQSWCNLFVLRCYKSLGFGNPNLIVSNIFTLDWFWFETFRKFRKQMKTASMFKFRQSFHAPSSTCTRPKASTVLQENVSPIFTANPRSKHATKTERKAVTYIDSMVTCLWIDYTDYTIDLNASWQWKISEVQRIRNSCTLDSRPQKAFCILQASCLVVTLLSALKYERDWIRSKK